MKSLIDYLKETQQKQNELAERMSELEMQQAELIINQEYANCLAELNAEV